MYRVLVMRKKKPDAQDLQTPFVPYVPLQGILICCALMYSLPNESWARLLSGWH
jgi:APA family basic amino acid/polyamine antiporter